MRPVLGICGILFFAVFAMGQSTSGAVTYQSPAGVQNAQPVLVTPVVGFPPPIGPGGLVMSSGYATTIAPPSAPLLVTPTAGFATVSSSPVGATDGTSNNQVGATNSSIAGAMAPLPAVQTVFQVNQPGIAYSTQPGAGEIVQASAGEFAGLPFNTGAAQFDVVNARRYWDQRSLGDVARQWREHPRPRAVRVFTNEDIARLSQAQPGSKLGPAGAPPDNPSQGSAPQRPQKRR